MRTELSTREQARQAADRDRAPRSGQRSGQRAGQAPRQQAVRAAAPGGPAVATRPASATKPVPTKAAPRKAAPGKAGPASKTAPVSGPGSRSALGTKSAQRIKSAAGTRSVPGAKASAAAAASTAAAARRLGVPRTPFVLLVLSLLGGGLVCLLVINTTLATASFRISNLQRGNAEMTQQEQSLVQRIAREQAPGTIERRAYQLGMRQQQRLNFLDVQTGRIYRQPNTIPQVKYAVSGFTP